MANLAMILVLVLVAVSLMTSLSKGDDNSNHFGASFVFGDSLVDAGNNNYLQTLSKANVLPNGIDFKPSGGNPTGRFTNGRTIADIIGDAMGVPNYASPYLAPNTTGRAILNGVNYASGGGGILNDTGRIFVNRLGMDIQVDYFKITRKQLDDLLGASKAVDYLRNKSIFSVTVGSNDFLNNYFLPLLSVGTRISDTPDAFVDTMIDHIKIQLTKLYEMDARKIVVANVGPIGCIPYQKTINQLQENECVELPNKLAREYNTKLKDTLADLRKTLPGSTIIYANVYDLVMELITNYKHYGFNTASTACCGNGGTYAGIIPCTPASSLCKDREKHIFWDAYHPSQAANQLIAKQLLDGDTKYMSPINLRQLRNRDDNGTGNSRPQQRPDPFGGKNSAPNGDGDGDGGQTHPRAEMGTGTGFSPSPSPFPRLLIIIFNLINFLILLC